MGQWREKFFMPLEMNNKDDYFSWYQGSEISAGFL